jgi:hypothetical protein
MIMGTGIGMKGRKWKYGFIEDDISRNIFATLG